MLLHKVRCLFICILVGLGITPVAQAQWAVVDVGAIVQLVQQVNTMRQQLETTRDQLQQARETLDSGCASRRVGAQAARTRAGHRIHRISS